MSQNVFWIFQLAAVDVFLPWITIWLAVFVSLSILIAVLIMIFRFVRGITVAHNRGGGNNV